MVFEDKGVTQPVRVDICVVCLPKYTVELDWMQTFSPRFILFYYFILFYFILFYFILFYFIYFYFILFYFYLFILFYSHS